MPEYAVVTLDTTILEPVKVEILGNVHEYVAVGSLSVLNVNVLPTDKTVVPVIMGCVGYVPTVTLTVEEPVQPAAVVINTV